MIERGRDPGEAPIDVVDSKGLLDPSGEGRPHEVVVDRRGRASADLIRQCVADVRIGEVKFVGRPLQRLAHHAGVGDSSAEQEAGYPGDFRPLLLPGAARSQGGRGSDRLEMVCVGGVTDAAHQEANVSALAAAVRVEFVEDEELETLRRVQPGPDHEPG